MQRRQISVLAFILCLAGSGGRAHTQPAGCYPIDQSAAKCECSIDTKWSVDLDLDDDQVPDFRQVRWEADGYCLLRGGARLTQRDTAEALFAVNGVELNMMAWPYQGGGDRDREVRPDDSTGARPPTGRRALLGLGQTAGLSLALDPRPRLLGAIHRP